MRGVAMNITLRWACRLHDALVLSIVTVAGCAPDSAPVGQPLQSRFVADAASELDVVAQLDQQWILSRPYVACSRVANRNITRLGVKLSDGRGLDVLVLGVGDHVQSISATITSPDRSRLMVTYPQGGTTEVEIRREAADGTPSAATSRTADQTLVTRVLGLGTRVLSLNCPDPRTWTPPGS